MHVFYRSWPTGSQSEIFLTFHFTVFSDYGWLDLQHDHHSILCKLQRTLLEVMRFGSLGTLVLTRPSACTSKAGSSSSVQPPARPVAAWRMEATSGWSTSPISFPAYRRRAHGNKP